MFLQTIAEKDATGRVAEIYVEQKSRFGFLMAADQCFTARPDLLPLYIDFYKAARGGFSLGLPAWRLITLIAAKHVPSTYCTHVYSQMLINDLGSKEAVLAVHRDFRTAGLPAKDVAMLTYAEQVTINASTVTQADIDRLRAAGFSDREICDIAFCAAWRCFYSRFIDAMGATPEATFIDEDEAFSKQMTVGKPL